MQTASEVLATGVVAQSQQRPFPAVHSRAALALRWSVTSWVGAMLLGQFLFALYLLGFYGRAAIEGRLEAWNDVLSPGYVPGDTAGNVVLASHLAFALAVTVAGVLQLMPRLRNRWPRFHRWNGRFFVLSATIASLGGIAMIWTRVTSGDTSQHVAITINGLLILGFGLLAWRHARARRFDLHRRWALRLFLAVNGGWFFRIGLMLWIVVNQGPVGFDPKTFTGPFLTFLAFAQYLLPLAVLELYLRAQSSSGYMQVLAATALGVATLATIGGIAAAAAILWLPRI